MPKAVFPIATVISGVVNLVLALVPLFGLLLVTGHDLTWRCSSCRWRSCSPALFTLGAGLLLSPLAVFFHDVAEIVGVVLTLLMYLTPVFYPMTIVPERLRFAGALQPGALDPRGVSRSRSTSARSRPSPTCWCARAWR